MEVLLIKERHIGYFLSQKYDLEGILFLEGICSFLENNTKYDKNYLYLMII